MQNGGVLKSILSVELSDGRKWEARPCGEYVANTPMCNYRPEEMESVVYTPHECWHSDFPCQEIRVHARFLKREEYVYEAIIAVITTCFVVVVLCCLAIKFQTDTQALVIAPIEKMVNIIKQLAEDPLKKPK